jgi:hypothetical protein
MRCDAYRDSSAARPSSARTAANPNGNTVWAIVDHDGEFAAPEPGVVASAAAAVGALAGCAARRRSRPRVARARRETGLRPGTPIAVRPILLAAASPR